MSGIGFVSDLPIPTISVREGDVDPITFTLKNRIADQDVPIDLSNHVVEMRLRPIRGVQTAISYRTDAQAPKLVVTDAPNGVVTLTPEGVPTPTFTAAGSPYRVYFNILQSGGPHSVPAGEDIYIDVIPVF